MEGGNSPEMKKFWTKWRMISFPTVSISLINLILTLSYSGTLLGSQLHTSSMISSRVGIASRKFTIVILNLLKAHMVVQFSGNASCLKWSWKNFIIPPLIPSISILFSMFCILFKEASVWKYLFCYGLSQRGFYILSIASWVVIFWPSNYYSLITKPST